MTEESYFVPEKIENKCISSDSDESPDENVEEIKEIEVKTTVFDASSKEYRDKSRRRA